MWSVWKQSWMPGRYRLPDGRTVEYSAADLDAGLRNARGMIAKGLPIPLAWKHVAENTPRPAEVLAADADLDPGERNLWTFGWVSGVRRAADGSVEMELTGRRTEDLERLKDVRFVSPQVHTGWTDADGQRWDGPCVTHVAAVGNPVQYRQRPVPLAADAPVWLSADAYEGKAMADEPKTDDTAATSGKAAKMAKLVAALRAAGMNIPDSVADLDDLCIAVEANGPKEEDVNANKTGTGAEAPPPPVMMSADQAGAIVAENAQLKGELLRLRRDDFKARAKRTCARGALAPTERDAWFKQLDGAVQLSADGTGTGSIPVQLAAELAVHEKLPGGAIWSGERQTAARDGHEMPLPPDALPEDEEEARLADADADAYAARQNKRQPA